MIINLAIKVAADDMTGAPALYKIVHQSLSSPAFLKILFASRFVVENRGLNT
jgi:hypothetical protein